MGDEVDVGSAMTCIPTTYRLPFSDPEKATLNKMFRRHNNVEIDAVEFDDMGKPIWWAIVHFGDFLNKAGGWERSPHNSAQANQSFRDRCYWASPECAVAHAYKTLLF